MIEIEASGLVTKKKRTLKERIAQTFKIILDIPNDLPGLHELIYLLSSIGTLRSSSIHRWSPLKISDFHIYDKPNYPVRIDPFLVFAEVTLKWKCKDCTASKTEKIYYELPGLGHPYLPERYWRREPRTVRVYVPTLSFCVSTYKARKEAERLAREESKKRRDAEMKDYEERIKFTRKFTSLEEQMNLAESLSSEASRNIQIARNLKILSSRSLKRKSRRFQVAVYRLVELGYSPEDFRELTIKHVNLMMTWYRVKKNACLNDSSCGMREFFE